MDTLPSSLQIRILIFRRWHYLQRRCIERAQFRLHDTAAGVAAIAAELGFCDQFHFSRVFRAITGCSPLQYRKNKLPPDQG